MSFIEVFNLKRSKPRWYYAKALTILLCTLPMCSCGLLVYTGSAPSLASAMSKKQPVSYYHREVLLEIDNQQEKIIQDFTCQQMFTPPSVVRGWGLKWDDAPNITRGSFSNGLYFRTIRDCESLNSDSQTLKLALWPTKRNFEQESVIQNIIQLSSMHNNVVSSVGQKTVHIRLILLKVTAQNN